MKKRFMQMFAALLALPCTMTAQNEVYDFRSAAPNKSGNTWTATYGEETTSTGGVAVRPVTNAFFGGDGTGATLDLNGRIACEDGVTLGASQGMTVSGKRKMISVLNLSEGDQVVVETTSTSMYIRSKNVSYVADGEETIVSTAEENDEQKIVSGRAYKMIGNGSLDFYIAGSTTERIQKISIFPQQTMTIGGTCYATFSSTHAIDISGQDNFKAYIATSEEDGLVTMQEIDDGIIPANTGVMLYGSTGSYYYTTTDKNIATNLLKAQTIEGQVKTNNGSGPEKVTNYLLANKDGVVGFYLANKQTLGAGKAYLQLSTPEGAAAAREGIAIRFDDDTTTAIEKPETEVPADNRAYDLRGALVGKNGKGLLIVNGKKVFNK